MASVYRICFQPVFEGQEEEMMPKAEDALIECVGVMAESLEEAIRKARDENEGTVLEWAKEIAEEMGLSGSPRCEKCIIIKAEHVCTIDIE